MSPDSHSIVGGLVHRYRTHSLTTATIGVALIALIAISLLSVMMSAPVRAVDLAAAALFGDDGSASIAADDPQTAALLSCIATALPPSTATTPPSTTTADPDEIRRRVETMTDTVPAQTAPPLAYAWLLYRLAHTTTRSTESTPTTQPRDRTHRQAPASDGEPYPTIDAFARHISLDTGDGIAVTDNGERVAVPDALRALDPDTDYTSFVPAAAIGMATLSRTGRITLSGDQQTFYADLVAQHCSTSPGGHP